MGIEQFFKSIISHDMTSSSTTIGNVTKHKITHFHVDFNSIIHNISAYVLQWSNNNIQKLINGEKIEDIPNNWLHDAIYLREQILAQIDDIISDMVLNEITNILNTHIDINYVKYIYLSIDGVPMKSKMFEQRKRRRIGGLISKIKKEIYKKWKHSLSNAQIAYEELKIEWSKSFISPGTKFMELMQNKLHKFDVKKICPNLVEYIISGTSEFGEGEKKIVDRINDIENGTHMIYSPDSDMTILTLMMFNKQIMILRADPNTKSVDVIDINKLRDAICEWISDKTHNILSNIIIINDVSILFTLFGNDVLPKIKSINVKRHFILVLNTYCECVMETRSSLINNGINISFLKLIFHKLSMNETERLYLNYMDYHWKNFTYITSIVDPESKLTFSQLSERVSKLGDIWNKIKKSPSMFNNLIEDDKRLILKLTNNINPYDYYIKHNKLPRFELILQHRKHHIKTDKQSELTNERAFANELLEFETMSGEYRYRLGIMHDTRYVIIDEFYWKPMNIDNKIDDTHIKTYLVGFKWIYNYYSTKWNGLSSDFVYEYDIAPSMAQLYKFVKSNIDFIDKIDLKQYEQHTWFTPKEHLLWITPKISENANIIKEDMLLNAQYDKLAKLLTKSNKLTRNETDFIQKHLDCRGVIFLTKCALNI
jgi:5'-3' exonuclease